MNRARVKKILLKDKIRINKEDIDEENLAILTQNTHFNIANDELFSTMQEHEDHYTIPANAYNLLEWEEIDDQRTYKPLKEPIKFLGELRPEQQWTVDEFCKHKGRPRSGILQAPCSFGKTFVSCSLIAQSSVPTIVLVHTRLLFRQWQQEIQSQLGIEPGMIGDSLFDVKPITVAIYKTALNRLPEIRDKFSKVIVDETHLCPADMFSRCVNGFSAKVKIGVSATPTRKDGKHVVLAQYFTPFLVKPDDKRIMATPRVAIVKTGHEFNAINPKRDWARTLTKLGNSTAYQDLLAEHAIADISKGRCPLILGERVAMLRALQGKIKGAVCLVGSTPEEERQEILEGVGTKYKAVLSTKIFDEGISAHRLDTLYLTAPNNNPIKLEQRIGRIIREHPDKKLPLVKDFWLRGIIVSRQQQSRLDWYREKGFVVV